MKKLKTIIYFLLIILSFCLSCTKEKSPLIETSGTIQNSGSPALDGCGWTIRINSLRYIPIRELPENFKIDNFNVEIKYRKLNGKFWCGLDYIEVVEIRTKN